MNKKKILIIHPYPIFPVTSGGQTRQLHTIKELSKSFEIDLIFLYKDKEYLETNQEWLDKQKINFKAFPIKERTILSFLKSRIPYWFSEFNSLELKKHLKSIDYSKYNSVLIEYTQLLSLVEFLPKNIKKIFTAYDISTISFLRRLKEEKNVFKYIIKLFPLIEVFLYEKKYLKQYNFIFTVSEKDKKILTKIFKIAQVKIFPNGIDKINFSKQSSSSNRTIKLGYIGSIQHSPNQKAIEFIIKKIAPKLEKRAINFKIYIAGNNSIDSINKIVKSSTLKNPNSILNLGKVQNIKQFYSKIDVLLAPIFSGSGTRIKILESLSFAKPVITTNIGAEGIRIDHPHLSIINNLSNKNTNLWIEKIKKTSNKNIAYKQKDKLESSLKKFLWSNTSKELIKELNQV